MRAVEVVFLAEELDYGCIISNLYLFSLYHRNKAKICVFDVIKEIGLEFIDFTFCSAKGLAN